MKYNRKNLSKWISKKAEEIEKDEEIEKLSKYQKMSLSLQLILVYVTAIIGFNLFVVIIAITQNPVYRSFMYFISMIISSVLFIKLNQNLNLIEKKFK